MWIGDLGSLCHITNDDNHVFNAIDIDESIQGSSGIMPATKKASYKSFYGKSIELNGSTLYDPWSFAPRQV